MHPTLAFTVYQRQTLLLVSGSTASRWINFSSRPNTKFYILTIFIVSNCKYLSEHLPPLKRKALLYSGGSNSVKTLHKPKQ
jgi:hypothetical protein